MTGPRTGTPQRAEEIARREPDVRLIGLPRNNSRGFARETGVQASRGRFTATVDADIVPPADGWDRCARELQHADAVGGTAIPDGDVAALCSRFDLRPRGHTHTTTVTGSNGVHRREFLG